MFDSERNKQHQRVLCKTICRLPNETIKQLAVRIEIIVRKTYSPNTHDYKSTKMTRILMMTLTPKLRKVAVKKRASDPSSIREPDLDSRKLVDKLEQAEITMKLEETENLKLQYAINIQTKTTQKNIINNSDTDLSEKKTEILIIYTRKTQIFKVNHHLRNGVNIAEDTDTVLLNADRNSKTIKINHTKTKNQINHSINTRRKIKIYQTKTFIAKTALENHYQIAQIIQEIYHLMNLTTEVVHHIKEIHEIPQKIDIVDHKVEIIVIEIIHVQTQSDRIICLIPVPIHNLGIDTTQMIDQETHHTIDIETIPTIGTEVIQIIDISKIIIDNEIIQTTDQITKDPITTIIKIDHVIKKLFK